MDPISAAASIVGLLGAAAKISETLFKFVTSIKGAPRLASSILQEVSDTSACLNQLQSYLIGTKAASRSHEHLLMIEQITVALSNCVLIFSELEEIVESLKPSEPMQLSRLGQWALKETGIRDLFTRLQHSKASLNLMMTTLTCASVGEAQASVTELATIVAQILDSNQEISRRMARLEQQNFRRLPSTALTITGRDADLGPSMAESKTVDDTQSILTVRGPVTDARNSISSDQRQIFGYSFDQDLNTSRPYIRAMQKSGAWSTTSSEIHTMGWSCLTGLSLAEVSHISVINLPFCAQELWNGHRYFETRIDRGGFPFPMYRSSLRSDTTQAVRTFRRRLETKVPVVAGLRGKTLSTNKEDRAVPVAAKTMLLIGESLSGKTTVFNHLRILYGNGITSVERVMALSLIIRSLVDMFIDALSVWSDNYDQDRQESNRKHFWTLVCAKYHAQSKDEFVNEDCQLALRHLWNNEAVRDTILTWNGPALDEKMLNYLENLEQNISPNHVLSDTLFLSVTRRGLGVHRKPIEIDHTQYHILDASSNKWQHCFNEADVVVFVVSLTSYCEFPYGDTQTNNMTRSMSLFASMTEHKQLKSLPFIVLLNKFDLFIKHLDSEPVRNYFPSYSGSPDSSLACRYFANEFVKLDKRPKASLWVSTTNAVDRDTFKATMDRMAQWLSRRQRGTPAPTTLSAAIPLQMGEERISD